MQHHGESDVWRGGGYKTLGSKCWHWKEVRGHLHITADLFKANLRKTQGHYACCVEETKLRTYREINLHCPLVHSLSE